MFKFLHTLSQEVLNISARNSSSDPILRRDEFGEVQCLGSQEVVEMQFLDYLKEWFLKARLYWGVECHVWPLTSMSSRGPNTDRSVVPPFPRYCSHAVRKEKEKLPSPVPIATASAREGARGKRTVALHWKDFPLMHREKCLREKHCHPPFAPHQPQRTPTQLAI
ncbi:hypothetical protein BHM03_00001290 [Ensete ventricosum]|nr:hypothetical protein BHM03_00001290 [Ensete ventricosum]